jgi:hypothetical protein
MNELTDLEICQRIAEIEGKSYWTHGTGEGICMNYVEGNRASKVLYYNPLTDDALCFKLMVKYSVDIQHGGSISIAKIYDDPEDNPLSEICFYQEDVTYNNAICLAIIKSKE